MNNRYVKRSAIVIGFIGLTMACVLAYAYMKDEYTLFEVTLRLIPVFLGLAVIALGIAALLSPTKCMECEADVPLVARRRGRCKSCYSQWRETKRAEKRTAREQTRLAQQEELRQQEELKWQEHLKHWEDLKRQEELAVQQGPQAVSASPRRRAISTPQEYLQRIKLIAGDDIADEEFTLHFDWKDDAEAKALLARIRKTEKQMRLLKKDVNARISAIKSKFTTARVSVGKSIGASVAAGFFGRRLVGQVNAARRDELRQEQINAVEPYYRVKRIIDQILYQLDQCKGEIKLSQQG